jgi:hypothetical protein
MGFVERDDQFVREPLHKTKWQSPTELCNLSLVMKKKIVSFFSKSTLTVWFVFDKYELIFGHNQFASFLHISLNTKRSRYDLICLVFCHQNVEMITLDRVSRYHWLLFKENIFFELNLENISETFPMKFFCSSFSIELSLSTEYQTVQQHYTFEMGTSLPRKSIAIMSSLTGATSLETNVWWIGCAM